MSELKLKPELLPMIIEGGFYLAALVSTKMLLINPLLSLTFERRRRTQGALDSAKGLESKLERLQKTYHDAHHAALTESRDMLNKQILAGQAEAAGLLQESHETAKTRLEAVRQQIHEQIAQERQKIPGIVADLSETVLSRLARNSLVLGFGLSLLSGLASASEGAVDPIYGILWPYFQFIVFAAALTFLARKAINKMLDDRRDALRTKLSEAREAITLAQRKSEEYEAKLKNLQSELDQLRSEYAEDGVRQRDKLIHEAKETSAQLLRDADRLGRQLISEGKDQLRKEIFDHVLATLDAKLTGDTLATVDSCLRQSALKTLQSSSQISASH